MTEKDYDFVSWLTPRENVTSTHVTVRGVKIYREPGIGVREYGSEGRSFQVILTKYDAKRFGLEPIRP